MPRDNMQHHHVPGHYVVYMCPTGQFRIVLMQIKDKAVKRRTHGEYLPLDYPTADVAQMGDVYDRRPLALVYQEQIGAFWSQRQWTCAHCACLKHLKHGLTPPQAPFTNPIT